jgi:negative regulator of replication initiation
MSAKKPAHEVVVEMLQEAVGRLRNLQEDDVRAEASIKVGRFVALLEVLLRMIIPEKYSGEVIEAVQKIKQDCPIWIARDAFPEEFFASITPSQKKPAK